MFHHVAHAIDRRALFTDWTAAAALWEDLARHLQGVVALTLMPDHVHAITRTDQRAELIEAARAFARWRRWHHGDGGRLWEPIPFGDPLPNRQHLRRTVRYLHLNPCRARLVGCPVAWPFSTYRDRLGLAAHPLVTAARDPAALHRYSSADPSTAVDGTPLPALPGEPKAPSIPDVIAATSAWRRMPVSRLLSHRLDRPVLLAAARDLTGLSQTRIASDLGLHRSAVCRAPALGPAALRSLSILAADDRVLGLDDLDPRLDRWRPRSWRPRAA